MHYSPQFVYIQGTNGPVSKKEKGKRDEIIFSSPCIMASLLNLLSRGPMTMLSGGGSKAAELLGGRTWARGGTDTGIWVAGGDGVTRVYIMLLRGSLMVLMVGISSRVGLRR